MRVTIRATHPLKTLKFLIVVRLVVILVLIVLLLLLLRFIRAVLSSPIVGLSPSALCRLFALNSASFLALAAGARCRVMRSNLLRGSMAPNVCHSLHFALLSQFFGLLLLLLQFEAFGRRFEFLLVHHEEVTWSTLGEVRLRQDVLDSSNRRYFTLVIDVL